MAILTKVNTLIKVVARALKKTNVGEVTIENSWPKPFTKS